VAKIIENGRATPVTIVHVGPGYTIWHVQRQPATYELFCSRRGGLNITFAEEDADELSQNLQAVKSGILTQQQLEDGLTAKIEGFLASVQQ
jgi:hypothetical protein